VSIGYNSTELDGVKTRVQFSPITKRLHGIKGPFTLGAVRVHV